MKITTTTIAWFGTLLTNVLVVICGIATGIIVARLLLPEGRGILAIILFWPQLIAGIGILSLNEAVTYQISKSRDTQGTVEVTAFYLALILALITSVLSYFMLPYLLGEERSEWLPLARTYLLLFIPFNFVALSLLAIDHGELKFTRLNLFRLSVPLIYLIGLIWLWLFNLMTVENVVWVNFCSTFIATALRIIFARKYMIARPSWNMASVLLTMGMRFHVTVVLLILASQVDRIVVMTLWNDSSVGLYIVAFTVASSGLAVIASSFYTLIFPTIGHKKGIEAQAEYLAKGLRYAMLLIVASAIPLLVLTPWLVPFLFGSEFNSAVIPTIGLLLAYIPMSMRQIIVRSLRGLGKALPGVIAESLSLIIFILLCWPLGSMFGLLGIGIALLLANLSSLVYLSSYLYKHLNLSTINWWGLNRATLEEIIHRVHDFFDKKARTL
jgi:O-antigen/teichoic acid export membrane protein